jgi:hypothetical protein
MYYCKRLDREAEDQVRIWGDAVRGADEDMLAREIQPFKQEGSSARTITSGGRDSQAEIFPPCLQLHNHTVLHGVKVVGKNEVPHSL